MFEKVRKGQKQISLLSQVAVLFVIGVIVIGALMFLVLYSFSSRYVINHLAEEANATASDLETYLYQYPTHDFLLRYWYEHYDEMDIEYDVDFFESPETLAKIRLLSERYPDFHVDYVTKEDVDTMSPEDQKVYAEVMYSRLITRIDQMEEHYNLSYLFCVATQEPYDEQLVLFIAARDDEVRGPEKGQIYQIGRRIEVTPEQQEAMRLSAADKEVHGAPSRDGKYLDNFYSIGAVDDHDLLIVVTRDIRDVNSAIVSRILDFGSLFMIMMLALAIVCLVMIYLAVLHPLQKIQENIRLYKDTKDSATVTKSLKAIPTHNELDILTEDVADLAIEIDHYTAEISRITEEKGRIETELLLARKIQLSMLPKDFHKYDKGNEFAIFASMEPAREVGGDFYDFFMIDHDHLSIMIADVSGKGIPAALFMMASKITLSHNTGSGKTPAKIMTRVNESICKHNPEDMFVTVWLGIIDLNTGIMKAVNAGHEYPIISNDSAFEILKDRHQFIVGVDPDIEYSEYEVQLKPGSKIFLYTDGLAEARNSANQMFSIQRILSELNKNKDRSCEEICADMRKAVADFENGTDQFDDLTMMCFEFKGR